MLALRSTQTATRPTIDMTPGKQCGASLPGRVQAFSAHDGQEAARLHARYGGATRTAASKSSPRASTAIAALIMALWKGPPAARVDAVLRRGWTGSLPGDFAVAK